MKKHNLLNRQFNFIGLPVLFCLINIFLFSCKTTPVSNPICGLDLLDNTSGIYLTIPKTADENLIKTVIKENAEGVSEKDIETIINRIDVIYLGINKTKSNTSVQMAIDGNIPKQIVPKILNKKNGWNEEIYIPENSTQKYVIYSERGINLAFPSAQIVCFGENVPNLLQNYSDLSKITTLEDRVIHSKSLDDFSYNFLKSKSSEIKFFANKPQSFLTLLTGSNLDLKLIDVYGAFFCDEVNSNQYILNLTLNFKNEKYLKAGRALLKLAFGLTNSEVNIIDKTVLNITNIHIKKEQVYKLLSIK